MNADNKSLVILTGPTAVGKTELSIALAKEIHGEIISADSMQVYKKMDIGSAKITMEERKGVTHHLIDVLEPTQDFNVVLFKKLANKAMEEIYSRSHIPILVGGTGFYIQAVLNDIDFTENDEDISIRERLEVIAKKQGSAALYEKLKEVDPKSCETIHQNNIKRVIRALEYYEKTGKCISKHNETERKKKSPYTFAYFVLNDERKHLYEKIDRRVDVMMESGLIDEVKFLKEHGCTKNMVSMQGLGYKEILDYLDAEISLEDAVYRIKRDTRHFAKRQLTWFRREKDVIWVNKDAFQYDHTKMLNYMIDILHQKGIIS